MKPSVVGLGAVALAVIAAASGCAILLRLYAPGVDGLTLFLGMPAVLKVCVIFVGLTMLGAALTGLIGSIVTRRDQAGLGGVQILLGLAAAVCTVFGVLAALYGEQNIWMNIQAVGPVRFAVTAVSHAEGLLALAIGLGGATFAMAISVGMARRRDGNRKPPARPTPAA